MSLTRPLYSNEKHYKPHTFRGMEIFAFYIATSDIKDNLYVTVATMIGNCTHLLTRVTDCNDCYPLTIVCQRALPVTLTIVCQRALPVTLTIVCQRALPVTLTIVCQRALPVTPTIVCQRALPVTLTMVCQRALPVTCTYHRIPESFTSDVLSFRAEVEAVRGKVTQIRFAITL